MAPPRNVLVLYDAWSTFTQTVVEHLRAFSAFSRHRVSYAHAARGVRPVVPLDAFDAVIHHYSIRSSREHLAPQYVEQLARFRGPKLLFIQDEYDATETARRRIESAGFDVVFTCVPEGSVEAVYPRARFPKTRFVTVLTGYVPPRFETAAERRPIAGRPLAIAYRGRPLEWWYGKLAREKMEIGQRMKEVCARSGIAADIEWSEESRIYGEDWYHFLGSAKATLGTESGSNVFDDDGSIRRAVEELRRSDPGLGFDQVWERVVKPHEGRVKMNQVSPKVFEAIGLGTALVLYEGSYSGVLEPGTHYLPLRKDLGNVEEVVAALKDDRRLQEMADRAWRDVIGSGRWSYRRAVEDVDRVIDETGGALSAREPFQVALGTSGRGAGAPEPARIPMGTRLRDVPTSAPLLGEEQISSHVGHIPWWFRGARAVWMASRAGVLLEKLRGR